MKSVQIIYDQSVALSPHTSGLAGIESCLYPQQLLLETRQSGIVCVEIISDVNQRAREIDVLS